MIIKNELARITVDLPADLQKKLKAVSAMNGISMREFVIKSIEKQLKKVESKTNDNALVQEI